MFKCVYLGVVLTPIKRRLMSECDCFRHKQIIHILFKNNPSNLSPMALRLVPLESWIFILNIYSISIKNFP